MESTGDHDIGLDVADARSSTSPGIIVMLSGRADLTCRGRQYDVALGLQVM